MSKEYNLKFHEALKRAVEDGVEIVQEELPNKHGNCREYPIHCSDLDGRLYYQDKSGPVDQSISTLMDRPWRVIEKPMRRDFECIWGTFSYRSNIGYLANPSNADHQDTLRLFVGKRTRVTIEEIP